MEGTRLMCSNGDFSENKKPIVIKDEGIIVTYKNPSTGEEYSVLGELAHNFEGKKNVKYKAVIYWAKEPSLVKQVAILRKICPFVNSIPNNELLNTVKGTSSWEFGEFLPEEAEELVTKGKQNGLDITRIELN